LVRIGVPPIVIRPDHGRSGCFSGAQFIAAFDAREPDDAAKAAATGKFLSSPTLLKMAAGRRLTNGAVPQGYEPVASLNFSAGRSGRASASAFSMRSKGHLRMAEVQLFLQIAKTISW
jgi:hypothetical protein